jgi:predicted dehydrogenase
MKGPNPVTSAAPAEPGPLSSLDRRRFLQAAATAGAALVLARPGRLFGATGQSDLRIALIGLGAEGKVLMEATLKIPGIRFVAVCDIWGYALKYGQRFLKKEGHAVNAYENFEDLLAREKDLDGVLVATPDFWHAPITNAFLKAGIHVYCEKMMSNTIEGARSMVQTMKDTGKLLQIGHQRRSNPRYLVAKNRLLKEARLLGRITAANGQWNRAVSDDLGWPKNSAIPEDILKKYGYENMYQFRNWRWFKKYGGGPLSDLGAHQIDIFNWFFDAPPKSVLAGGGNDYYPNHEWFDNAMAIFEYETPEGIARAFYEVLTTTSAGGGYFEQFMGTDGTLKMSENPKYTAIYREARAADWSKYVQANLIAPQAAAVVDADSSTASKVDARETAELATYRLPVILNKAIHQPHLENFFNAIRGTAKLNCPADEAFRSEIAIFKAIEAVYAQKMIYLTPADWTV